MMKKYSTAVLVLLLIFAYAGQAQAATASGFRISTGSGGQTLRIMKLNNAQIYLDSSGLVLKIILPGSQADSRPTTIPSPTAPATEQPAPDAAVTASSMQQEMLGYMNAERAKVNASPLVLDQALSDGAYLKSADMATKGYFSHTSPTYGSPFAMMNSLGISYRTAAENIAMHTTVKDAQEAFMNSPGHQANILNPAFGRLGLGFYKSGNYLYITQWFAN